jgi:hypothetical protein
VVTVGVLEDARNAVGGLVDQGGQVLDPTQAAGDGTETFLRTNPITVGPAAISDAVDTGTGSVESSPLGIDDFVLDLTESTAGADIDGDSEVGGTSNTGVGNVGSALNWAGGNIDIIALGGLLMLVVYTVGQLFQVNVGDSTA